MSTWKAFSGRISLIANIPTPPMAGSVLSLYQQIWSTSPQSFQQAPNPLMPSTAQGIVNGMLVSCSAFANRVDFNLSPDASGPVNLSLRLIEDGGALRNELFRIGSAVGKGLTDVPDVFGRAAIFVQFAAIEPSVAEANKAITRAIPEKYRIDLSDEEAFVLQIASPISVPRIQKAKLNVVTKWSVEQFHVVSFGMAVGGAPGVVGQAGVLQPQVARYHGASVSFDCITTEFPSKEQLTKDEQAAMLLEGLRLTEKLQLEYGLNVQGYASGRTTH